jgi:phenylalanyl-tRNA synthetase beta chain
VAKALLAQLGLELAVEPMSALWCAPGRGATLYAVGKGKAERVAVGVLGEVHPAVLEAFDIGPSTGSGQAFGPVAYLEMDIDALLQAAPPLKRYAPFSRFPGAWRDLGIMLNRDVPTAKVAQTLRSHPLVTDATLIDVYEGKQLPEGKRALTYRVHLQAPTRTLTGDEVNEAVAELWHALRREVGAEARG